MSKKATFVDKSRTVRAAMRGDGRPGAPQWEERYHVMMSRGKRVILQQTTDDGIVRVPHPEELPTHIFQFAERLGVPMSFLDAQKVALDWRAETTPIEEPALILQKTEFGLTFHRMPFDFTTENFQCPVFDEWVSRMGASEEAFKCWLGSLFFEDSDLSQYAYLYGEGRDGKSTFIQCLKEVLGPGFRGTSAPVGDGIRFWAKSIFGKRLVAFSDFSETKFLRSGVIKKITGGDVVDVEGKGEESYQGEFRTKLLFASNTEPNLSAQKCDMRRVIYCELQPFDGPDDHQFFQKFLSEAPHWLSKCRALYMEKYPERGVLDVPEASSLSASDHIRDDFDGIIRKHLVIERGAKLLSSDFITRLNGSERPYYTQSAVLGQIYKYLTSQYDVKQTRCSARDRRRAFSGARLKMYPVHVSETHERNK